MSDFRILVLRCRWLEVVEAANENKPDPVAVEIFKKSDLPVHEVSVGPRAIPLHKIEARNGQTIAYYQSLCINPQTGATERYAWRYRIVDGKPTLDRAFPVEIRKAKGA